MAASSAATELPPDEQLPPNLCGRTFKELPCMRIAFKQRVQIGVQVHSSATS